MSAHGRKVDAGLWRGVPKRAYEEPVRAPQRYQDKYPLPVELNQHLNPRGATEMLVCPRCGRVRQYNARIQALTCGVCELVWYRGRRYRLPAWDAKWERKVKKNVMSVKR
jgi:ribosomal protein L37E